MSRVARQGPLPTEIARVQGVAQDPTALESDSSVKKTLDSRQPVSLVLLSAPGRAQPEQ